MFIIAIEIFFKEGHGTVVYFTHLLVKICKKNQV